MLARDCGLRQAACRVPAGSRYCLASFENSGPMESPLPEPKAKKPARRLPTWLVRHHLTLFVLSVLVALAVSSGLNRYLVDAFVAQSSREKATALELIGAFVDTYAANLEAIGNSTAPVPATFRAHALSRFSAGRAAADRLGVVMVGMPGREIATPPSDDELTAVLLDFVRSGVVSPVTTLTEVGGQRLLRTVLPSLAGQDSCVQCHNALQPGANWQRGDMMGAFVVDVPADWSLARFRRDALL
ncbi:MAG: DUF3365 domain-containing protein, partial [Alphaproteobacteria bacterium]|nr:DUF3365 domain-containing protein [Alphaproteobacteria bacterium]